MSNTKIIILNGAPNSGKDMVAAAFVRAFNWQHCEFKKKLFQLTQDLYCVNSFEWSLHYGRAMKEQPWSKLNGLSPRQALINVSENIVKPNFGKDYFGKAAALSVIEGWGNIFSDGGFMSELVPLIDKFGQENILLIRLHRDGCTFAGDSRAYLYPEKEYPDMYTEDILNNGTEQELFDAVYNVYLNTTGGSDE